MAKTLPSTTDEQLLRRERNLLGRMRKHIERDYGFRCGDYEPDCCLCRMWHAFDQFKAASNV